LNGNTGLEVDTWYHIAGVFDRSVMEMKIYIDGNLDAISTNSRPIESNSSFNISYSADGRYLNGTLDEVRIWNDVRSETEIRQNMYKEISSPGSDLIAYYKLNENDGTTTAIDSKGSYNGTLTNMTGNEWETSAAFFGPKNALEFEGGLQSVSPDYAYKTSNVTLVTDNFTMMAWVYPDVVTNGAGGWRCIAYNGDDAGGYGIGIENSKVAGLFGTAHWNITDEVLITGNWYHIAMRRNIGTVQFFLNGELLSYSNTTAPLTPSANFTIGNMYSADGSSLYTDSFDGKIDEVRVYDAALTDDQIIENMCNSLEGDEDNLVAYYNFDNSAGTTLQAFDGSTSNDLTLVNMTDVDWVSSSAFNTWLNTSSTTWNEAANWSNGGVPTSTDNVGIQDLTTDPVIDITNAACNNLTINSGGALTINAAKALTIDGNLINLGTFTINSTSSGTGSLIVEGTATGSIIMQRYIAAAVWGTWDDGWHFLSSPVANYDISSSNFTVAEADYDFYAWSEPNNLWINFKTGNVPSFITVNGSDDFELGHGYMAAYKNADTKDFTGTINVSDVDISNLDVSGSVNYYSWHLLGNPFTSALTWWTDWTTSNIAGVAKIWNEVNKSYTSRSNGEPIPATNGFMVQATADDASLTIPASKRVHSSQAFYKDSGYPLIKLKANNIDNPSAQESEIRFNPESTLEWDMEFDSDFLSGYAPFFYSQIGTRPLAVNSMPDYSENTVIPFTFIKNEGLNFSIEMYEIENMDMDVWLLDKKTNTEQNLSQNPIYIFTSFENDNIERFKIRFKAVGIEEPETEFSNIQIWSSNKTINILNPEHQKGTIRIINIYGQKLIETQLIGNEHQEVTVNVSAGNYIVNVVGDNKIASKKIFVK